MPKEILRLGTLLIKPCHNSQGLRRTEGENPSTSSCESLTPDVPNGCTRYNGLGTFLGSQMMEKGLVDNIPASN
ncbi:unnamed protein product, partial [Vitis vinifera]